MLWVIIVSITGVLILLGYVYHCLIKVNIRYAEFLMAYKDEVAYESSKYPKPNLKEILKNDELNARKLYDDTIMSGEVDDATIKRFGIIEE